MGLEHPQLLVSWLLQVQSLILGHRQPRLYHFWKTGCDENLCRKSLGRTCNSHGAQVKIQRISWVVKTWSIGKYKPLRNCWKCSRKSFGFISSWFFVLIWFYRGRFWPQEGKRDRTNNKEQLKSHKLGFSRFSFQCTWPKRLLPDWWAWLRIVQWWPKVLSRKHSLCWRYHSFWAWWKVHQHHFQTRPNEAI